MTGSTNNINISMTNVKTVQMDGTSGLEQSKTATLDGSQVKVGTSTAKKVLTPEGPRLQPEPTKLSTTSQPLDKSTLDNLKKTVDTLSEDCDKFLIDIQKTLDSGKLLTGDEYTVIESNYEKLVASFKELQLETAKLDTANQPNLEGLRKDIGDGLIGLQKSNPKVMEREMVTQCLDLPDQTPVSAAKLNSALDSLSDWLNAASEDARRGKPLAALRENGIGLVPPSKENSINDLAGLVDKITTLQGTVPKTDVGGDLATMLDSRLSELKANCIGAIAEKLLDNADTGGILTREPLQQTCRETIHGYYQALFSPGDTVPDAKAQENATAQMEKARSKLVEEKTLVSGLLEKIRNEMSDKESVGSKKIESPKAVKIYIGGDKHRKPQAETFKLGLPGPIAELVTKELQTKLNSYIETLDEADNLATIDRPSTNDKSSHESIMTRRRDGVGSRGGIGLSSNKSLEGLWEKISDATVSDAWKESMTSALKKASLSGTLDGENAERLAVFLDKVATRRLSAKLEPTLAKFSGDTLTNGVRLTSAEVRDLIPLLDRGLSNAEANTLHAAIGAKSKENFNELKETLESYKALAEKDSPDEWPPALGQKIQSLAQQASRTLLPADKAAFDTLFKETTLAFQMARFEHLNKDNVFLDKFTLTTEDQKTLRYFCIRSNCEPGLLIGLGTLAKTLDPQGPNETSTFLNKFLNDLSQGGEMALAALDMLLDIAPTLHDDILALKLEFAGGDISADRISLQHQTAREAQEIKYFFANMAKPESCTAAAAEQLEILGSAPLSEIPLLAKTLLENSFKSPPVGLAQHVNVKAIDLLLIRCVYHHNQASVKPSADFSDFIADTFPGESDIKHVFLLGMERRMEDTSRSSDIQEKVEKAIGDMSSALVSRHGVEKIIKTLARDPQQATADNILRERVILLLDNSAPTDIREKVAGCSTDELISQLKMFASLKPRLDIGQDKLTKLDTKVTMAASHQAFIQELRGQLTPQMVKALADIDRHLPDNEKIVARGHLRFSRIRGQQMALSIFALNTILQDTTTDNFKTLQAQLGTISFQSHLDFQTMRGCNGPLASSRGIRGTSAQSKEFKEILKAMKKAGDLKEFTAAKARMQEFYQRYNLSDKAETVIALEGKRFKRGTAGSYGRVRSAMYKDAAVLQEKHKADVTGKLSSSIDTSDSVGTDFKNQVKQNLTTKLFGQDQNLRASRFTQLAWNQYMEKREWKSAAKEIGLGRVKDLKLMTHMSAAADAAILVGFRQVPGTSFVNFLDRVGGKDTPEHKAAITSIMQFTGCNKAQAETALATTIHKNFTNNDPSHPTILGSIKNGLASTLNLPGLIIQGKTSTKGRQSQAMSRTEIDKDTGKLGTSRTEIARYASDICHNRLKPGKAVAIDIATGFGLNIPIPTASVTASVGLSVARERGISITVDDDGNVSFALAKGHSEALDLSISCLGGLLATNLNAGLSSSDGIVLEFKNDNSASGRAKFEKFFTAFMSGQSESTNLSLYSSVETFGQTEANLKLGVQTDVAAIITNSLTRNLVPSSPVDMKNAEAVFRWNPISLTVKAELAASEHIRKSNNGQTETREQQVNISITGKASLFVNTNRPIGNATKEWENHLKSDTEGFYNNPNATGTDRVKQLLVKGVTTGGKLGAKAGLDALQNEVRIKESLSNKPGSPTTSSATLDAGRAEIQGTVSVKATGLCSQTTHQGKLQEATQTFSQTLGTGKHGRANLAAVIDYYNIENKALRDKMTKLTSEDRAFTLNVVKKLNPEITAQVNKLGGPENKEAKKLIGNEANYYVSGYSLEYTNLEVDFNVGFNIFVARVGMSSSGRDSVQENYVA